ncbi:hypothetical protein BH11ACT8_BH11ACT8_16270 [soil metagenome]
MQTRHAMRALGSHLGADSQRRARDLAHTWGAATAGLRMTPSIIVVGAQRAGTTTLFRLLEAHPQLVRPTLSKGTGYFDDGYDRSWHWYQGHFPLRRPGPVPSAGQPVTFECSGYYLFHPLAAARIASDLPDVRVVVLVRDPVERAFSAHRHELARGYETLPLADALAAEGIRTAGESVKLERTPGYRSFAHRHHAYVQRGEYAHQVRRFRTALGADRVHVLDADLFFADPRRQFAGLQQALGLSTWLPAEVAVSNARPGPPADPDLRGRLMRHFEPHDSELGELLGEVPSWRRRRVAS